MPSNIEIFDWRLSELIRKRSVAPLRLKLPNL
jgi:hypothetical protein